MHALVPGGKLSMDLHSLHDPFTPRACCEYLLDTQPPKTAAVHFLCTLRSCFARATVCITNAPQRI